MNPANLINWTWTVAVAIASAATVAAGVTLLVALILEEQNEG